MGQYKAILDDNGEVIEVDGTASSFNIKGKVVNEIDLKVLTKRFLKYELENGKWLSLTGKGETTK